MKTDFSGWTRDNLVSFARDSDQRIKEQEETITQLRSDFKNAMEHWRNEVKENNHVDKQPR
jgi:hypothetical protein